MITEGLLGIITGGAARLLPEIVKIFTAKRDQDHEFRMANLQWTIAKEGGEQKIRELDRQAEGVAEAKGWDALIESIKAQAKIPEMIPLTGKWYTDIPATFVNILSALVGLISQTVRPFVTYWMLTLYSLYKWAVVQKLLAEGSSTVNAYLSIWTPDDVSIMSSIFMFWFVDRQLTNREKRSAGK